MQEEILGDYRILKHIGWGALGDVLLAEHRFIKRRYALKVLPQEFSQDAGFITRFESEVRKLSELEHPHIVKLHTVSFASGYYFLVSDCIADLGGKPLNLAQFMQERKERLKEEDFFNLLRQIASALDYAHLKAHVVHRALKPNNILFIKNGKEIEVAISDFGLTKMVSAGKVILRTLQEMIQGLGSIAEKELAVETFVPLPLGVNKEISKITQSFLQSYAFLAPEQKCYENVEASADIYAFGVLAYYLISGKFPEGIFPLPSQIALEYQFNWDELIIQCLRQEAAQRPVELLPLLDKVKQKKSEAAIPLHQESSVIYVEEPLPPIAPLVHQTRREESSLKTPLSPVSESEIPLYKTEGVSHIIEEEQRPKNGERISSFPTENPFTYLLNKNEKYHLSSEGVSVSVSDELKTKKNSDGESIMTMTETKVGVAEESYSQQLNSMLHRDPIITQYQPEKRESKIIEPLQTEMHFIKGGHFQRGSNNGSRDEMPVHKVFIDDFCLDIHPITNEQFVRFLEYMGGEKDQNYNDLMRLKDSRLSRSGGRLIIEPGYAKHPVVGVTWYGAFAYAKWAGKRLPTEAEWEIASRGGDEKYTYPSGDHIEKSQANFFSSDTTPVMSFAPNGYGLYDMAGNVYEWCNDWYGYNYYETSLQEPQSPKGPHQGVYRVLRGGCWKSLQGDLRCAHRHRNNPGTVNSTYGFRCAAEPSSGSSTKPNEGNIAETV